MKTYSILSPTGWTEYIYEVCHVSVLPSGYGHKKITVSIHAKGNAKNFSSITSCMPCTDKAEELEGQEKSIALFEIIQTNIEKEISEWIYNIDMQEIDD